MVWKRTRIKKGERLAAWAVLTVLVSITVWLGLIQGRLSPAVLVALAPPKPVAGAQNPASGRTFATAAFLSQLPGAEPASPVDSYDADTLSDRIDGKAELYLAANFQEMSTRTFTLTGGARVDVAVYAQKAPSDAFAVLSGQRRSGAEPSPVSPDAYATENALFFSKGSHYAELSADRADPATREALVVLGTALARTLPGEAAAGPGETATLDEKSLFPKAGLVQDSIRLAVSDAMGMEGFANVYTAEYELSSGQGTVFLALRDTAEAAVAQARAFAGFLTQNGYKAEPAAADRGLPPGAVLLAMDGSFEIVWTKGRLLAGVHDATSREAALELAGRLAVSLKDVAP